jgi:hypothetical protein
MTKSFNLLDTANAPSALSLFSNSINKKFLENFFKRFCDFSKALFTLKYFLHQNEFRLVTKLPFFTKASHRSILAKRKRSELHE